jgi:hypothetical protein
MTEPYPPPYHNDAVSSTRDLADLARAGYGILQQPSTNVDFEVHHTADRPGYLRDNIFVSHDCMQAGLAGAEAPSAIVEALASAANGVGLVIGTNAGPGASGLHRILNGKGAAPQLVVDETDRRVFRGSAPPNPTFLFESAATYEGVVSVEPAPRSIKFYESIAVRDLIREISRIAADVAGQPLLYLQTPAQLPAQSFVRQDVRTAGMAASRRSSSLAVRFAIALQRPSARIRFKLTDILRRYCTERKFGLWLADTRMGYRSGNWFQICPHADDLPRRERMERAASMDSRAVEACLPITFVGPARIGSTHTIVSFLCQFSSIGITSCSVITLDDLSFIHLQLSASGVRRSTLRHLNSLLAEDGSWHTNPAEALIRIHGILVPRSNEMPDHVRVSEVVRHAGDYQTMVGPILGCTVPDRGKRIAAWFCWQMEGTDQDLSKPLSELFRCFSGVGLRQDEPGAAGRNGGIANLEYLICRDIGNRVLRGRGKLSIPEADMMAIFGGSGMEVAATRLCVSLEDAWTTSLRQCGVRGVSELTVAWREWWLGHWASPI